MRGGRAFSTRGGSSYNRGGRGGYRGQSNSTYRGQNTSGRYDNQNNGRSNYGSGGSGHYNNSSSSSGGRPRYQNNNSSTRNSDNRRSSYNSSYSRDRGDSPDRKRFRHEGGGSRRDFGSSSDRFDSGTSYRSKNNRRSPGAGSRSPFRDARGSSSHRSRDMGPPTRLPPRKFGNVYRGRATSSRGIRRSRIVPVPRATTRNTVARRRIVNIREQDTARRAKIAHLRSKIKKRTVSEKAPKSDEDEDSDKKSKTDENGDNSADASEKPKKKTDSGSKSGTKKPSTTADAEGTDETVLDGEAEEVNDDKEAVATDAEDENVDENGEKTERKPKKEKTDKDGEARSSKKYIELTCVHCQKRCLTFQEYSSHLFNRFHRAALRRVAMNQKLVLNRMRVDQRNTQRELDEATNNDFTSFCMVCRLNYRSPKADHQASADHLNMKKFLMPYCKVCRIRFKSPMDYEVHRCSLDHIKRKARQNAGEKGVDEDEQDELQVDLDKFTIVDSVGDIDGVPANENEDSDEKGDESTPKADINVGSEHVRKVDAYFCDLCQTFLSQQKDLDVAMKKHCTTRMHLRSYLRYKEDQSLRLTAEKIHRRHQEERETKKGAKDAVQDAAATEDETADDKVWADVDKDLGELLQQAGNANEDEDEDSTTTTERYDRFKNSGKLNAAEADKIDEIVVDNKNEDIGEGVKA